MRRLPWATALLGLACLASTWVPGAAELLAWDREAIAGGEAWRLFSGLWVHLSPSHLVWNLAALGAAGALLESRDRAGYLLTLGLAVAATGPLLLVLEPGMARFGGVSGLAASALVFLCLEGVAAGGGVRAVALFGLALVAAKVGVETWSGAAVFARVPEVGFQASAWAHAVGAAAAASVHGLRRSGLTVRLGSVHSRLGREAKQPAREGTCTWTVSTR